MTKQIISRVISILLAFVIFMGVMVGCNNTTGELDAQQNSEMKTIRMLGIDYSAYDQSGKSVNLSDWINDPECRIWQKVVTDLEERGIRLEVELFSRNQYFTALQTKIISGLEDYDWVFLGDMVDQETRSFLIEQGIVMPINEIWENYSDGTANFFYSKGDGAGLAKMRIHEDGNIYYLGNSSSGSYDGLKSSNPYGINIRYDWLEKIGAEIPETTEELYQVLMEFQRNDVNGSGVRDEVVSVNWCSFENGFAQAFGLGHELICFDPVSGEMTSPFYQENIKEYFAYMNKLYRAGLLDTTFADSSEIQENKLSATTQYFVYSGDESRVVVPEGALPVQWVPIMPLAECADKYTCKLVWTKSPTDYFGVTSSADKEAIGILLDYISSVEFDTLSFYGIEGYSYALVNGYPVKYQNPTQSDAQVMSNFFALWVYLLPSIQRVDYKVMLSGMNNYPEKVAGCNKYYLNMEDYGVFYSPMTMMGESNKVETERIAVISVDLKTYTEDLMLNLVTGEKSLDDWDSYIKDLKTLGLDEMLEIYQERFERYLKNR